MSESEVITFRVNGEEKRALQKIMEAKKYTNKSKAIKASIQLMASLVE